MLVRNLIKPLPKDWAEQRNISGEVKACIQASYAPAFREYILANIDEDVFRCLYSPSYSRPNYPVNQLVGVGILAAYNSDTPIKKLIKELPANFIHRYALDLLPQPVADADADADDDAKSGGSSIMHLRNFQRFIEKCVRYRQLTGIDLIHICFDKLFHRLAEVLEIDGRFIRMDSMMIRGYCRNLSRHELLYVCNSLLVKELHAREIAVPDFARHYCDSDDRNNVLYRDIPLHRENTIARLIEDAHGLILFCDEKHLNTLEACQVLTRVFAEQTIEAENGTYRLRTSEDGGMSSSIIQTPYDCDMTYRSKNGEGFKGYAANLIEAFGGWGTIIFGYSYEQNIYSDVAFFRDYLDGCNADGIYIGGADTDVGNLPYLCDLEKKYEEYMASHEEAEALSAIADLAAEATAEPEPDDKEGGASETASAPATDECLLDDMKAAIGSKTGSLATSITDGAFHSVPNTIEAIKKGILHVPTNLTGTSTPEVFAGFVFPLDGTSVIRCPAGHAPISCSYNSRNRTCCCRFASDACMNCGNREVCEAKRAGRKGNIDPDNDNRPWIVYASQTKKIRAVYEQIRSSEEFSLACRFRNGVETLPSILRRAYGVDVIPVRGLFRSSVRFSFAVAGLNVQKLITGLERKARNDRLSLEDYTREGRKKRREREAAEKARRKEERARAREEARKAKEEAKKAKAA